MKLTILSLVLLYNVSNAFAQDSTFSVVRVIAADALSKNEIFDKTLIWCSKSFNDSKSAINVKEREGGIIAGKAYYYSDYKIPKRKDSVFMSKTFAQSFVQYHFDWLIEIKDHKLRFGITNVKLTEEGKEYPIESTKAPYGFIDQSTEKTLLHWNLSKSAFLNNVNQLINTFESELRSKKADW